MSAPDSARYEAGKSRLWVNLFPIENQAELIIRYRLIGIRGLPRTQYYDKNVSLLKKRIAFALRAPTAIVRRGEHDYLVIPAGVSLPSQEYALTPHVAILEPEDGIHTLGLGRLDGASIPIAVSFLYYAFSAPLRADPGLWGHGRTQYARTPLGRRGNATEVDLFPGFAWNIAVDGEGRLLLSVDTHVKYVDRCWLSERVGGEDGRVYAGRRCLYCFGPQWYLVQLLQLTGLPIEEQRFQPESINEPVDVYTYTLARWHGKGCARVDTLDPRSPAILYRTGGDQDRYGAAALARLTLSTAHAEASGLHRLAIMPPQERFQEIKRIVQSHFQAAQLDGRQIRVAPMPSEAARRVFPLPPLMFSAGHVLAARSDAGSPPDGAEIVPLEEFGRRRLQLVLDHQLRPLDLAPFDAQYLLLPVSAPRWANEAFARRFERTMRRVSGDPEYTIRWVLYDDRGASSLHRQVEAITVAITANAITRGYALLVLPEQANPGLHNYIKRAFWPHLQMQCATATAIRRYAEAARAGGRTHAREAIQREFDSYVRNCAFGMLVVNRKWPWALATPLHYDLYLGIDVLNGIAGVTLVFGGGHRIMFRDYQSTQAERLTARQVRTIIARDLGAHLTALGARPRTLVVHRDGCILPSEIEGLFAGVDELQRRQLLPLDVNVGIVDIRKTTADHLRLVEGDQLDAAQNPVVGSYFVLNSREGLVCTTGRPYRFPGTAHPLAVEIREGPLDIEWSLQDIFALAQLGFTAPDKCVRLPITIKLNDDLLQPIAARTDDEAALYDDGEPGDAHSLSLDDGAREATSATAILPT